MNRNQQEEPEKSELEERFQYETSSRVRETEGRVEKKSAQRRKVTRKKGQKGGKREYQNVFRIGTSEEGRAPKGTNGMKGISLSRVH